MCTSTERRVEQAGWLLFIASAVFLTWASWSPGEMVALAASVFFLLACLVLLVPLHGHRVSDEKDPAED